MYIDAKRQCCSIVSLCETRFQPCKEKVFLFYNVTFTICWSVTSNVWKCSLVQCVSVCVSVCVNASGSLLSYLAFKAQVRLQAKLARWVTAHTTRNGALGPQRLPQEPRRCAALTSNLLPHTSGNNNLLEVISGSWNFGNLMLYFPCVPPDFCLQNVLQCSFSLRWLGKKATWN